MGLCPQILKLCDNCYISSLHVTVKKNSEAYLSARSELEPLASLSDLGTLRDSFKVHHIRAYNNEPHRASLRLISRSLHIRDLDGLGKGGIRVNK